MEKKGFSVVRDFCGHGIGRIFHEALLIFYIMVKKNEGIKLETGMIFTVEPMINDWFISYTKLLRRWMDCSY